MFKKKLTPKQERFCREYVKDSNGTKAAIRAGFSKKTANEQASRMLANVNIKRFVDKLKKKLDDKIEITAERVLQEIARISFSNAQDYISSDNEIKDISKIDPSKAAAISSIKKSKTEFGGANSSGTKEVVEFKLWDKNSALEKLAKHLGLFKEDNEQLKPDLVVTFTETIISKKV